MSVTYPWDHTALICGKHRAPLVDLPTLVFYGKCQSGSTIPGSEHKARQRMPAPQATLMKLLIVQPETFTPMVWRSFCRDPAVLGALYVQLCYFIFLRSLYNDSLQQQIVTTKLSIIIIKCSHLVFPSLNKCICVEDAPNVIFYKPIKLMEV